MNRAGFHHLKGHELSTETVLQEAERLINGDRQDTYGGASESFGRIASLWSAYLGHEVSALDVTNLMILLKVSRTKGSYHRDSYVDIGGYAGLGERLHEEAQDGWDRLDHVPPGVIVEDVDGDFYRRINGTGRFAHRHRVPGLHHPPRTGGAGAMTHGGEEEK